MYKMMFLTGSDGNPRSFPVSEVVELEETYPYLIRSHFQTSTFWQLSIGGNISASELLSQPMGYLTHWNPDFIVVQTGMVDCRPEAFSEFQKEVISTLTWKFFGKLKKHLYDPALIKKRQLYRVPKSSFQKTVKQFKLAFPKSKILWLEICAGARYEETRPGITNRMAEYNAIIQKVYGEDFIPVQKKMMEVDGFNTFDFVHWNKRGHQAVAEILLRKMSSYIDTVKVGLK